MDLIAEIIDTLNEEDKDEFASFLNRHRNRKDRKDLELFDAFNNKGKQKRNDLLLKLYPDTKNQNAYHATRKRLIRQLMEFVQLKKSRGETLSEGYMDNLVSMSEYLFHQAKEEAAWILLKQAKDMAEKSESYRVLNNIYSLQIAQSHSEHAPDLKEILKQKKKFQKLAIEEDKANTAYHLIRYELNQSLSTGKEIDVSKTIKKILQEYDLEKAVTDRPRLMYNIVAITRSSVLAGKEFYSFEPYIIKKYHEIEKKGSFNKYNHYCKVNLLYMIAHVLYRNKKFEESEKYLELLYDSLLEHNRSQFLQLYTKYNHLLAAVYNYSGRNKQAIELLEKLVVNKKITLSKPQMLNTYLNLSTYYFQRNEFSKSIKIFQKVQHSDTWLTKIMGFEWVLKMNIIECINQFELGNSDIVEQRLNYIEKHFKEYFNREMYKRVKTFLGLVRMINNDPAIPHSKEFYEKVENSFVFIESEKEDIQAMTFYGWLKAKMQKRKYYEVLLELVHSR